MNNQILPCGFGDIPAAEENPSFLPQIPCSKEGCFFFFQEKSDQTALEQPFKTKQVVCLGNLHSPMKFLLMPEVQETKKIQNMSPSSQNWGEMNIPANAGTLKSHTEAGKGQEMRGEDKIYFHGLKHKGELAGEDWKHLWNPGGWMGVQGWGWCS